MPSPSENPPRRERKTRRKRGQNMNPQSQRLSIPATDQAILKELESWIREGRVEPGQRLPSIKAIQNMLRVGQRGVNLAMEALARRGLIETRNRSGNYLLSNAKEILSAESGESLQSAWMLDHYLPRNQKRTLTIFTIDCVGRMRGAWSRAATAFAESHGSQVRVLTPNDGHLNDLLESQGVDVVHTTPEILDSIGWDRFQEIDSAPWLEDLRSDLLPQVSSKFSTRTNACTVPFAITVMYLFYNRSLAAEHGLPLEISPDPMEFLRAVRRAQETLAARGLDAFQVPGLADILRMTGGLVVTIDGRVTLDRSQSLNTIEILTGSKISFPNPSLIPGAFASGRLLAMRHPSFTSSELLERAAFDWQALASPLALGLRDASWLTMLAVPKSSASKETAVEMIGHLVSETSQREFASVGGNLPVRRSALSSVVDADLDHVSAESLHRALSQSELSWPHMAVSYLSADSSLHSEMRACSAGHSSPTKVFEIIEALVSRNSPRTS